MLLQKISNDTNQVLTLAQEKHWRVKVMEQEGLIAAPVFNDGWWYAPIYKPDSTIPPEALRRVDTILKSGIRPQGMIVGYEIPVEVPTQKEIEWEPMVETYSQPTIRRTYRPVRCPPEVMPVHITKEQVETALKVLTGLAVVTAIVTLTALSILAQALAMADPVLIMVMEDGKWIEIARWYD